MSSVKKIKGGAKDLSSMISNTPLEGMARDYAKTRLEAKMLKTALSTSQQQYASLFLFMMAVLRQMPGYEIRFSSGDLDAYKQFKDSWELQQGWCEETEEVWLRLVEKGGGDG